MPVSIIVGGQHGDEGKGAVVAYLALNDKPKTIARGGVGPNAGHTVWHNGKKYGLRMIPCGFIQETANLYVGAGTLVDPEVFMKEIDLTSTKGRAFIDKRCAIITADHKERDTKPDLKGKIGTTGTGCGPANADRAYRSIQLAQDIPELEEYIKDVPLEVNTRIDAGENVLIEGTQGSLLSLFYGSVYPFVTSKDTTASAFAMDVGIGPTKIDDVIIVLKSFHSRVGEGPLPGEMSQEEAERLGIQEFGTVTGRPRRISPFNFDLAKYTVMLNGATQIALTCTDYLDKSIMGCKKYDELSQKVKDFIDKVETELKVPVTLVRTGPDVNDLIDLRAEKLE